MAQEQDAIRRDIEATRDRMAPTLDALAERVDVPKRVRGTVRRARDEAVGRVDQLVVGVGERIPAPGPNGGDPLDQRPLEQRSAMRRRGAVALVVATGGVATVAGAGVAMAMRSRSAPPQRLAGAARHLPEVVRSTAVPAARAVDAWLDRAAHEVQARRTDVVHAVSQEIGRAIVAEQRRQTPFWSKVLRDVATAAATTAATLTVRRVIAASTGGGTPA